MSQLPRALCITTDPALRRTLRRTLQASGSSVEFRDSLAGERGPARILFLDQEARKNAVLPELTQIIGENGKIVVVGASLEDDDVVALLRHEPLDHVISDGDAPDEIELVVTSCKLLSGDIFGLEKYLAWGAKVHETEVHTYEEKRVALLAITDYARELGARRQVIAKIESVADELLMNAMYDAPAIRKGVSPTSRIGARHASVSDVNEERALLRYACDGRHFAVAVQDNYGELHKEAILDHLTRARAEKGKPRTGEVNGGAGLGLYFILSSVTRFIANIDPGRRTEVICLFDLRQTGREADACARSLHIFRTEAED